MVLAGEEEKGREERGRKEGRTPAEKTWKIYAKYTAAAAAAH